ncbi:LAME_0C03576g1_1 [Lachancea meyersii CBS 8951]|uniref:LAME_0C03576g1_1 n=1 Tax=Lachancea meyersii CBS 8951 TaxID=1266667 RepID=A0A1G4J091_9SACH|nr:LAME_0C03576g1_1 [Lachancea meyersii CBS 8951]
MSAKTPILDNLVSSEVDVSDADAVKSDEDESFMQLDGDAFRLDMGSVAQSGGKSLFVRDDSVTETPVKAGGGLLPQTSPTKRVQFNEPAQAQELQDLWDFKKLVRLEFERRLPQHYELRGWRSPPRNLVSNLVTILETNIGVALDECFAKYEQECERVILDRSVRSVQREKEHMLFELVGEIERRLSQARFPSRCSDRDLDIEYIYAKRQFIQNRYSQESQRVEAIQHQVQREQTILDELKAMHSKTAERNARKSKLLTDQLSKNLHPALSKAMINSFGLLRDKQANPDRYRHDVDDLNLNLKDSKPTDSFSNLQDNFPAIKQYRTTVQNFQSIQRSIFQEPKLSSR